MKLKGKCSHFGGPRDMGVSPSEGLAFIYEIDMKPELFLPVQPSGTTGLARRLNPLRFYIATRWDYDETSKEDLLDMRVLVRSPKTGRQFLAMPADWGPAGPESDHDTGRIADISPGLMKALGITTDDEVEVVYGEHFDFEEPTAKSVVISSGHGKLIRGAAGPEPWGLDEVDEARLVVARVAEMLDEAGIGVIEFHDDESTTQDQNLANIVDFHNSQVRNLDVSVHFNAYEPIDGGRGCEVYAISQIELADKMSAAMAEAGALIDRGAKDGGNLYFCNNTDMPSLLVEVVFVDAKEDVNKYNANFDAICAAIANAVADSF